MSRRRLLWLVVILIGVALYFPINRLVHHGVQLILPIDKIIPLYPPAVVPYLLADVLFIGFPIWAAFKTKPDEFEAYTISILTGMVVSYFIYLVYPTFVARPQITSSDAFSRVLALVYYSDRAFDAAPSGHTFYSVLSLLYFGRWKPNYRLMGIVVVLIILASTLLTRQHYVLDLVFGLTLAILAYAVGRFSQKKWNLRFAS